MHSLLQQFGIRTVKESPPEWPKVDHVLVPYDADGRRLLEGDKQRMWLDLRDNQKVRITPEHNIQQARQPQYMHIGANKPYKHKGVERPPGQGLGAVVRRDDEACCYNLEIDGVQMRLGLWWLETAKRGGMQHLPIVNVDAKEIRA